MKNKINNYRHSKLELVLYLLINLFFPWNHHSNARRKYQTHIIVPSGLKEIIQSKSKMEYQVNCKS